MAINYDSAMEQMQAHGLCVSSLTIGTVKPVRCAVDGEKGGKKGWYWLHEIQFESGEHVLVGSFGIWRGQDNGAIKITLPKDVSTTSEEKKAVKKRIEENKKRMIAEQKKMHDNAAKKASEKWRNLLKDGESGYLLRKNVRNSGVKFTSDGAVAVPMRDTSGRLHGLQFILDKSNPLHKEKIKKLNGSDKRFWPNGLAMRSHFHVIGKINSFGINIITEGYATADTLNQASSLPCIVCFTATNIQPVLEALKKYHPKTKWLIAADDDYLCRCQNCKKNTLVEIKLCQHCNEQHGKKNTGVSTAERVALPYDDVFYIQPLFLDRKLRKRTDFNDLAEDEGLEVVAHQLKLACHSLFSATVDLSKKTEQQAENRDIELASLLDLDEAVARFSLVFDAKDMVYDALLRKIIPIQSMKNVLPDHASRDWKAHPDRQVILLDDITFDATGKTKKRCNMWGGFPSAPSDKGSCEKIIEILAFLCSAEKNMRDVLHQVLCFLAYPLQNSGAKLDMCLLFQGVPGTGKNLLFEDIMMTIYGSYSVIVGQSDVESQFNGWASKKLFVVADEVIAKRDLYQVPGKIKNLITGTHIPIRTLFTPTYQELNQINFVFLSNEIMPMVVEDKDRRFLVIKTPDKALDKHFYDSVGDELKAGGAAAFHHFLLNYDVRDFNKNTRPISTRSKEELITLCKPSSVRFHESWLECKGLNSEKTNLGVPYSMCDTDSLYRVFRRWCAREGETYIPTKNQFIAQIGFITGIERKRVRICSEYRFLNDGSGAVAVSGERYQVRAVVPVDVDNDYDSRFSQLESATIQIQKFKKLAGASDA